MLRALLLAIVIALLLSGFAFAGTNCEVQCCKDYKGRWDDRWDRCWRPASGYDECVSNCTAQTIHKYSSQIDKSDIEPIECKIGALILSIVMVLAFARSAL
ncbi:MAG: hypothetical protein N3G76_01575 [Candidatus Micrarchaeota archaeon]|nr:hypothetical protein [Candidatus Micrarchaeota archaeon]